jgi:hypothetical protein
MDLLGPWMALIFGVGTALLLAGIASRMLGLASEFRVLRNLERTALDAGFRMMLGVAAAWFLIWALESAFGQKLSNLPGG